MTRIGRTDTRKQRSAKVIDLKKHAAAGKRYQERLAQSIQRLDEAADALWDDVVNLTMTGPWREWNEQQPVGSVASFGPKEIMESGDPRIAALVRLCDQIHRTRAELRGEKDAL